MTCSNVEGEYEGEYDPRVGIDNNDINFDICDCPCSDLIAVKSPNLAIMALPYIAQAITVTIVGINMAFRFVYIKRWPGWERGCADSDSSYVNFKTTNLLVVGKKTSMFGGNRFRMCSVLGVGGNQQQWHQQKCPSRVLPIHTLLASHLACSPLAFSPLAFSPLLNNLPFGHLTALMTE
jgi:hypothetical protein